MVGEEPPEPPLHQAAYDAIDQGDSAAATTAYEQALRENPRDALARAGLAQVGLLARTQDVDRYTAFFHALLARGVYLPPSAFEAWFVNAALAGEALDRVLEALPAAARAAAEVGA